jgi:hypothetical protein
MAAGIGIAVPPLPEEAHYHLHGLEPQLAYNGERWLRLASFQPETIDYVDFYCNDIYYYTAYDEPFSVHYLSNWRQGGTATVAGDKWRALIHLRNGQTLERTGVAS